MAPTRQNISNWKKFHELFSAGFINNALGAAAELGIADAVSEEPRSTRDLAESLGLNEDALYRVLRALAAYGIFEECEDRRFRHNSFSDQLRKDHPFSIQGMAELWHCEPMRKAWGSFADAIRDGRSAFLHGNGASIYEYLQDHPTTAALFHRGMENNSAVVADAIAQGFPFGDYKNVVDLAGGMGRLLATILEQHPITGAVYDLPVVAASAKEYFAAKGLGERAEFVAGDWFESVPAGFDVYIVKNSLWNWTDEYCSRILANIGRALSRTGILLIIEYLPQPSDAPWSAAFDLQQLNVTGGRGRTAAEYAALLAKNGMQITASFAIENEQVLQCRCV